MAKYINFSDEDLYRANSVDLVSFLQHRGETLQRVGNTYKLIYTDGNGTHDSITISDSRWFDHKNNRGGRPVKFMQEYYGMSFQDAVLELIGGHHSDYQRVPTAAAKPVQKKPFVLPEANDNMRRAFAYLVKQRFIAPEVISHFAREKKIYEEKAHHNVVFVGTDESGVPRQAHQRSTITYGNSFRMTVESSDTKYSFSHFGVSNKLYVFEAPIDMLSYLTLYPQEWQQHSYIAMNGVYESAVLNALKTHENLEEVMLCTDNDIGGIEAADRLRDILLENGYPNIFRIMPINKDFNEDLKSRNGIEPQPPVPHRRRELFREELEKLEYLKVQPDRAIEFLTECLNRNSYTAAARLALGTAAVLYSYETGYSPETLFRTIKSKAIFAYKSYTDKGNLQTRQDNFRRNCSAAINCLRNCPATAEQNHATVNALIQLADSAARYNADIALTEEQAMSGQEKQPMPRLQFF